MFAPFEKEYGTSMETWPEWRLQQARILYKIAKERYRELGDVKATISFAKSLDKIERLLQPIYQ